MLCLYLRAISGLASEVLGGGGNAVGEERPMCLLVWWSQTQLWAQSRGSAPKLLL